MSLHDDWLESGTDSLRPALAASIHAHFSSFALTDIPLLSLLLSGSSILRWALLSRVGTPATVFAGFRST